MGSTVTSENKGWKYNPDIHLTDFYFAGAVREKFGEHPFTKKWSQIRQPLNQKCLDSKRKLAKKETQLDDDSSATCINDHDS